MRAAPSTTKAKRSAISCRCALNVSINMYIKRSCNRQHRSAIYPRIAERCYYFFVFLHSYIERVTDQAIPCKPRHFFRFPIAWVALACSLLECLICPCVWLTLWAMFLIMKSDSDVVKLQRLLRSSLNLYFFWCIAFSPFFVALDRFHFTTGALELNLSWVVVAVVVVVSMWRSCKSRLWKYFSFRFLHKYNILPTAEAAAAAVNRLADPHHQTLASLIWKIQSLFICLPHALHHISLLLLLLLLLQLPRNYASI